MYFRFRYCIWSIWLIIGFTQASAAKSLSLQDIVSVGDNFISQDLLQRLSVYQTGDASLTVRHFLARPEQYVFQKADFREIPYEWSNRKLNWVYFTICNESDKIQHLFIEQAYVNFNEILFYEVSNGKIIRENKSGDNYPFYTRLVNHRSFLYPVELQPQETRSYYFRLDNRGRASALYFTLATERHFWEKDYTKQLALGVFFGLLLLLLLHNVYLYAIFRDKAFIWFACYLFSLLMLLFSLSGLAFQLLWPGLPYIGDRAPHFFVYLVIFLTFILTEGMVMNNTVHPVYLRLITACKYASLILMFACFTNGLVNQLTVRMMYPMLLIGHGSLLGMNIIYLYKRYSYARFYTVSLLFMVVVLAVSRELYTPDFKYSSYLLLFFLTFYVSIIDVSLLDRLKIIKEEKERTQQLAIERLENLNEFKENVNTELQQRVEEKTQQIMQKQQEVNQYILIGEERERKRVAEELHDGLGGLLSALKLNVERIDHQGKNFTRQEKMAYQDMLDLIDRACQEVRNISHNMLPVALEHFGLGIVLQNMARQINHTGKLWVDVEVYGFEERIDRHIELHLYRIVLELFNNILKHAGAQKAVIQLVKENEYISLLVEDDGKGFSPSAGGEKGIGLINVESRVKIVGGNLSIDTSPQSGTTIIITIPFHTMPHENNNTYIHSR
jgi:signal transduction histidine kinase